MSVTFLAVAAVGFVLAANAVKPLPVPPDGIPSFFAGWLTAELAPQHLVGHVIVTGVFVALGAVEGVTGTVALALAVATAVILIGLIVQSQRSRDLVERAMCDGLGTDYADAIDVERRSNYDLRVPWRQLLLPFWMHHPDVAKVKNLSYGPDGKRNQLDVLHRRDMPTGCPVLLQVHGGAWVMGNKEQQAMPLMLHLAARGWVCVAINYRISPKATWPDHIVDVKRALAWVKEHIAEYGGDPDYVVVTGGSAGGHLSSLVALTPNRPDFQPGFEDADTTVRACLSYYGVYDFTAEVVSNASTRRRRKHLLEPMVMKRTLADDREAFEAASPILQVNPDAPPFFVIHGRNDTLVPVAEARRFVARLREVSQSPVAYAELPGGQHAFEVFPSIRTAHVVNAAERFVDHIYAAYAAGKHQVTSPPR